MKEIFRTILITSIRTIVYPIIYTIGFLLVMYLLRLIFFYTYSLIDQYILILYIGGIVLIVIRDFVYKTSIGIFLIIICVPVLYLSYFFPPQNIPQYIPIGDCEKGKLYLDYSGALNNTYLVYNPGNRTIPAEVYFDKKEIELHSGVELSQYDEKCEVDKEYTVREYTL